MNVILKRLALAELDLVAHLTLVPEEEMFAGKLDTVLEALRTDDDARFQHPFAILNGRLVVGLLVLKEGPALPAWASGKAITLHNFRIGAAFQGKGYGRAAMALATDWVRQNRPTIERLMLAANLRNRQARRFYARCGFCDTSATYQGSLGRQTIFALDLRIAAERDP